MKFGAKDLFVFGSSLLSVKRGLLGEVWGLRTYLWCIAGDFNVVRFLGELGDLSRFSTTMRKKSSRALIREIFL